MPLVPQISVIIPSLNEEPWIVAAIESAWAAGADQVLVSDGGSGDATVELARRAGAQVLMAPQPGRGVQQALGCRHATGQLLVFLHADSRLETGAFQPLRGPWKPADLELAWGGFWQRIDARGWSFRWLEHGNRLRARCLGWVYGDQALWVSAVLLERVGGFPPDPLMEDLILSRRLRRWAAPRLLTTAVITSARRWQRQGILRRTLRNWWLLTQYFFGTSTGDLAARY